MVSLPMFDGERKVGGENLHSLKIEKVVLKFIFVKGNITNSI